MLSKR
jgi:hypothetical protein